MCCNNKNDFRYYAEDETGNTYNHNCEDELFIKTMLEGLNENIDFSKEEKEHYYKLISLAGISNLLLKPVQCQEINT